MDWFKGKLFYWRLAPHPPSTAVISAKYLTSQSSRQNSNTSHTEIVYLPNLVAQRYFSNSHRFENFFGNASSVRGQIGDADLGQILSHFWVGAPVEITIKINTVKRDGIVSILL